ncbi:EF-hand domain-containing protein [Thalassotalea psychrophila]|uniref:EF-hand domain-containing protein n=1 Tax=Thalassotalea psychrophila TaxID=3065647 RepID=A0ABY9TWA3_9GAMM|nr:EF-hand domain-containing protein [Colwelliaceae bacterium SQ149]
MKKIYTTVAVAALMLGSISSANAISEQYFAKLDINNDGSLDVSEFSKNLDKYFEKKNITDPEDKKKKAKNGFNKKDLNGDGKLTFEEMNTEPKK